MLLSSVKSKACINAAKLHIKVVLSLLEDEMKLIKLLPRMRPIQLI